MAWSCPQFFFFSVAMSSWPASMHLPALNDDVTRWKYGKLWTSGLGPCQDRRPAQFHVSYRGIKMLLIVAHEYIHLSSVTYIITVWQCRLLRTYCNAWPQSTISYLNVHGVSSYHVPLNRPCSIAYMREVPRDSAAPSRINGDQLDFKEQWGSIKRHIDQ